MMSRVIPCFKQLPRVCLPASLSVLSLSLSCYCVLFGCVLLARRWLFFARVSFYMLCIVVEMIQAAKAIIAELQGEVAAEKSSSQGTSTSTRTNPHRTTYSNGSTGQNGSSSVIAAPQRQVSVKCAKKSGLDGASPSPTSELAAPGSQVSDVHVGDATEDTEELRQEELREKSKEDLRRAKQGKVPVLGLPE